MIDKLKKIANAIDYFSKAAGAIAGGFRYTVDNWPPDLRRSASPVSGNGESKGEPAATVRVQ